MVHCPDGRWVQPLRETRAWASQAAGPEQNGSWTSRQQAAHGTHSELIGATATTHSAAAWYTMHDVLQGAVAAGLQAYVSGVVQANAASAPESFDTYTALADAAGRVLQPLEPSSQVTPAQGTNRGPLETPQAAGRAEQSPNEAPE